MHHNNNKILIFDTETSGLPTRSSPPQQQDPVRMYDTARLVSLAWLMVDPVTMNIVQSDYYVVRPEGFTISENSAAIHGITHDTAVQTGLPVSLVLRAFYADLMRASLIVCHNVEFDIGVMNSEFMRGDTGLQHAAHILQSRPTFCTMKKGMAAMKQRRYPKLIDLHRFLHPERADEPLPHLHHAKYDTQYCLECFMRLSSPAASG